MQKVAGREARFQKTKTKTELTKLERVTIMKMVKSFIEKMTNADPNIWGYVMLNDESNRRQA